MHYLIHSIIFFLFFTHFLLSSASAMDHPTQELDEENSSIITPKSQVEIEVIDEVTKQKVTEITRKDPLTLVRMERKKGDKNYGYIYQNGFKFIQPEFVQLAVSNGGKFLEIGAAKGRTLEFINDKQEKLSEKKEITYVLNEINESSQLYIKKHFSPHKNRIAPQLSKIDGVIHVNNPGNKGTYHAIYAGMVPHFFPPCTYLDFLVGCNMALQPQGRLFFIQNIYDWPYNDPVRIAYDENKKSSRSFPGYFISEGSVGLELLYYAHEAIKAITHQNKAEYINLFNNIVNNPQNINYDPLHYNDSDTIKSLLTPCGFKIIKCSNYKEIYGDGKILRYLGVIAEKINIPEEKEIKALKQEGEKLEQAYQKFRTNLTSLEKYLPAFLKSSRAQ